MTTGHSMKKGSMQDGTETSEHAVGAIERRVRGASRWALPGTLFLVLLMLASSSAAATGVLTSGAAPASLHLAAPHGSGISHARAPVSSHPALRAPAHLPNSKPTPADSAAPRPSYVENGSATFFSNVPIPNPVNNTCAPYGFSLPYYYCWNTTTEPTMNLTTTGYTGLAYTAFTNDTSCAGASNWTDTEVGFVISTNFGNTWSTPKYLGNPVCSGYPDQNYSSAFEPSLTSLANGTFVLSYIEYNSSLAYYGYVVAPPTSMYCGYLTGSRVVVSESYNNGTTWTTPTVINGTEYNSSVNSCPVNGFPDVRPQVTAFGSTIYLAWSNVSNPLYDPYYDPFYPYPFSADVQYTYSTDGGTTWQPIQSFSPIKNTYGNYKTDYATDPSLMVSPSGELYIAYSTNYTWQQYCGSSYCSDYTEASIEVATSTNNGTTFTTTQADQTVFANYPNWYPYTYWEPFTTMAYSSVNDQAYLAFSAAAIGNFCYNEGMYGVYCYQNEVDKVWFQSSSNNGTSWSTTSNPSAFNATDAWDSPAYNPSFAVAANGQIDLQYVELNESNCVNATTTYGSTYYCAPLQDNYVTSDNNGSTWTNPVVVAGTYTYTYGPYRDIWDGFTSSTIVAGGQVLLGWTQVACPTINTSGCDLPSFSTAPTVPGQSAEVMTSRLYEGVGLTITFNETGLPSYATWSVNIQGNIRDGPAGTNLQISGVPPGSAILYSAPILYTTYGVRYNPSYSVASPSSFAANSTVVVTFAEAVLVNVLTVPTIGYNEFWTLPYYGNVQMSPAPGPNWVTSGTSFTYSVSYISLYTYCYNCLNLTFLSWSGVGPGSVSTNSTSLTFTPTGPVNETASFQENGYCFGSYYVTAYSLTQSCFNFTYALNFQEQGLPANTSWGITLINPNATTVVQTSTSNQDDFLVGSGILGFQAWTVPTSTPGQFWVPSSTTSSPLALPQPTTVLITYTLESIDESGYGLTFSETGLPNGTAWSLEVGGQSYGLKTSNGTVTLTGGASVAVNGSAVYLESGDGYYVSSIEVTPFVINETGSSVSPGGLIWVNGSALVVLHYSPLYRLTVAGTAGGTTAPASNWVRPGQTVSLSEAASSGYHFVDWSGSGPGSVSTYSASPTVTPTGVVEEFATFRPNAPATWNVTLTPVGLPSGATFSVSIGGTTYSGTGSFKVGNLTQGDYDFAVPTVYLNSSETSRYLPTNVVSALTISSGVIDLDANGTVTITYAGQFAVSIGATGGGTVSWGTSGSTGVYWLNDSQQVSLVATPDPHYYFVSWNGTGNGSVTSTTSTISLLVIGPSTETAQFQYRPNQPPATYSLAVTQTGLPPGTPWSVAVGGLGASGSGETLTVVGLNGSYELSASTIYTSAGIRWISNALNLSTSVTANGTFSVTYSEQFEVTVLGAAGGSVTPLGVQWVAAGTTIDLSASANSSSLFLAWNGTGSGNYTGSSATATVTVAGPVTEQVAFGPQPVTQKSTSTSPASGQAMALGLLVVLLVVGLVVGLLVGRRRSPPPMAEAEPAAMGDPSASESPMDGGEEMAPPPMAEYDEGPATE
jgi:List-Bact-rpt repeat protein